MRKYTVNTARPLPFRFQPSASAILFLSLFFSLPWTSSFLRASKERYRIAWSDRLWSLLRETPAKLLIIIDHVQHVYLFFVLKKILHILPQENFYFTQSNFIRGIILSHLVESASVIFPNYIHNEVRAFKRIKRTFDESRRWAPIAFIINVIRCTWGAHEHVVMRPVYTTLAKDIDIVGNASANTILSIPGLLSVSNETMNESANWSTNYNIKPRSYRVEKKIEFHETANNFLDNF